MTILHQGIANRFGGGVTVQQGGPQMAVRHCAAPGFIQCFLTAADCLFLPPCGYIADTANTRAKFIDPPLHCMSIPVQRLLGFTRFSFQQDLHNNPSLGDDVHREFVSPSE